jgi:hypothetical protein
MSRIGGPTDGGRLGGITESVEGGQVAQGWL